MEGRRLFAVKLVLIAAILSTLSPTWAVRLSSTSEVSKNKPGFSEKCALEDISPKDAHKHCVWLTRNVCAYLCPDHQECQGASDPGRVLTKENTDYVYAKCSYTGENVSILLAAPSDSDSEGGHRYDFSDGDGKREVELADTIKRESDVRRVWEAMVCEGLARDEHAHISCDDLSKGLPSGNIDREPTGHGKLDVGLIVNAHGKHKDVDHHHEMPVGLVVDAPKASETEDGTVVGNGKSHEEDGDNPAGADEEHDVHKGKAVKERDEDDNEDVGDADNGDKNPSESEEAPHAPKDEAVKKAKKEGGADGTEMSTLNDDEENHAGANEEHGVHKGKAVKKAKKEGGADGTEMSTLNDDDENHAGADEEHGVHKGKAVKKERNEDDSEDVGDADNGDKNPSESEEAPHAPKDEVVKKDKEKAKKEGNNASRNSLEDGGNAPAGPEDGNSRTHANKAEDTSEDMAGRNDLNTKPVDPEAVSEVSGQPDAEGHRKDLQRRRKEMYVLSKACLDMKPTDPKAECEAARCTYVKGKTGCAPPAFERGLLPSNEDCMALGPGQDEWESECVNSLCKVVVAKSGEKSCVAHSEAPATGLPIETDKTEGGSAVPPADATTDKHREDADGQTTGNKTVDDAHTKVGKAPQAAKDDAVANTAKDGDGDEFMKGAEAQAEAAKPKPKVTIDGDITTKGGTAKHDKPTGTTGKDSIHEGTENVISADDQSDVADGDVVRVRAGGTLRGADGDATEGKRGVEIKSEGHGHKRTIDATLHQSDDNEHVGLVAEADVAGSDKDPNEKIGLVIENDVTQGADGSLAVVVGEGKDEGNEAANGEDENAMNGGHTEDKSDAPKTGDGEDHWSSSGEVKKAGDEGHGKNNGDGTTVNDDVRAGTDAHSSDAGGHRTTGTNGPCSIPPHVPENVAVDACNHLVRNMCAMLCSSKTESCDGQTISQVYQYKTQCVQVACSYSDHKAKMSIENAPRGTKCSAEQRYPRCPKSTEAKAECSRMLSKLEEESSGRAAVKAVHEVWESVMCAAEKNIFKPAANDKGGKASCTNIIEDMSFAIDLEELVPSYSHATVRGLAPVSSITMEADDDGEEDGETDDENGGDNGGDSWLSSYHADGKADSGDEFSFHKPSGSTIDHDSTFDSY